MTGNKSDSPCYDGYVFTGINRDIGASIDLLTQSVIEISQIAMAIPSLPIETAFDPSNYAYGLELDRALIGTRD